MSMGIFTLTLAANESREVAISGEYFELRNALFPVVLIELLDRSGGVIARLDNPEQSDFVRPGRYETIRITNGATAQTVRHFFGSGDAGSRRTSGQVQVLGTVGVTGDVSVIDGEKSRTLAGGMYSGTPNSQAAAGLYSVCQLWNPLGSGKNLIVASVGLAASTASIALVYTIGASAPTDQTVGRSANKLSGAPLGVGQVRVDASNIPNFSGNLLRTMACPGSDVREWDVRGAVVVPPGNGLSMVGTVVNTQLIANFEWFEEVV